MVFRVFSVRGNSPTRARADSFLKFLDYTKLPTTIGRTPLYQESTRRRDLYHTTHNTYNRQTTMPPAEFEPAIPASKWPQTFSLQRSATRICVFRVLRGRNVTFIQNICLKIQGKIQPGSTGSK